jgi:hypothetical protein
MTDRVMLGVRATLRARDGKRRDPAGRLTRRPECPAGSRNKPRDGPQNSPRQITSAAIGITHHATSSGRAACCIFVQDQLPRRLDAGIEQAAKLGRDVVGRPRMGLDT